MADQQDLLKQGLYLTGMAADEGGYGGEMGYFIAAEGFEDDVGVTAPLQR